MSKKTIPDKETVLGPGSIEYLPPRVMFDPKKPHWKIIIQRIDPHTDDQGYDREGTTEIYSQRHPELYLYNIIEAVNGLIDERPWKK